MAVVSKQLKKSYLVSKQLKNRYLVSSKKTFSQFNLHNFLSLADVSRRL